MPVLQVSKVYMGNKTKQHFVEDTPPKARDFAQRKCPTRRVPRPCNHSIGVRTDTKLTDPYTYTQVVVRHLSSPPIGPETSFLTEP